MLVDATPEQIGSYEVLRELGRGGMGIVYLARQPGLDRLVALKIISPATPDFAARLRTEALALASLQHPHIVGVIDVGEDDGKPFYVMPYFAGGTMAQVLERDGRLAPAQVSAVLTATASALAAMHAHAVLHRDVKPSNILLSGTGDPYLADFGLVSGGPG